MFTLFTVSFCKMDMPKKKSGCPQPFLQHTTCLAFNAAHVLESLRRHDDPHTISVKYLGWYISNPRSQVTSSELLKTVACVSNHAMHGMLVRGTHVPITLVALHVRLHVAELLHNPVFIPIIRYLNCMIIIFSKIP